MRKSLMIGALLAFIAGGALAQTGSQTPPPPAQKGPQNSAINSSDKQVNAPVQGRNSFTEGEAKSRIEKAGFSNVSGLKKDDTGVWRGKAMKDGQSVDVSLDYQGNVVTR
jgi:opacity protein-like surface antigen